MTPKYLALANGLSALNPRASITPIHCYDALCLSLEPSVTPCMHPLVPEAGRRLDLTDSLTVACLRALYEFYGILKFIMLTKSKSNFEDRQAIIQIQGLTSTYLVEHSQQE